MDPIFNNPLGWVQHALLGGWRRSWVVAVVYLCLGMGILLFVTRVVPVGGGRGATPKQFGGIALLILLGIQSVLLLIAGAGWVRRAVQRDFSSNMIDSHRLTPMTGWTAVFGYIIGPNLTFAPITLVNLFFAVGFSIWGGYPWWTWLVGLCIIACAAGAVASLSLLMALCSKGSANVVGLVVMGAVFGGGAIMFLVPGLGLLVGSFSIMNMFRAASAAITFDRSLLVTIAGQLALTLIAGKAASRKYLRADVQAFSWPLGMVMYAFVLTYGGLGLRLWEDLFSIRFASESMLEIGPKWIATLTVVALFAMLPLSAVIQQRETWQRHHLYYPEGAGPAPTPFWCVLVSVAAVTVAGFAITLGREFLPNLMVGESPALASRIGLTLIVLVAALLPITGILKVIYRVREKAVWFVAAWVVASWALLPAVDLIWAVYSEESDGAPTLSWLTGCSPAGAWAMLWLRPDLPFAPGIVVQVALAVLMGMVMPRWRRGQAPVISARPAG